MSSTTSDPYQNKAFSGQEDASPSDKFKEFRSITSDAKCERRNTESDPAKPSRTAC
jgi:hypothetical protein